MTSNTLTNTKITETYVGVLHSNGAVLPSIGQQDIYDGGGNKSAIKIGRACNGVTVCGPLSCSSIYIGNIKSLIDIIYPVNSIFLSTDSTNPSVRFANTTWTQISQGRFLAGEGYGNDGFGNTFTVPTSSFNGEYRHTLTISEMPSHSHVLRTEMVSAGDDNAGASGYFGSSTRALQQSGVTPNLSLTVLNTGSSQSHNNIPPGFGIYVWKRTA